MAAAGVVDRRRLRDRARDRARPLPRPGRPRRGRRRCGARSSATCARSAGCWPARGARGRRRGGVADRAGRRSRARCARALAAGDTEPSARRLRGSCAPSALIAAGVLVDRAAADGAAGGGDARRASTRLQGRSRRSCALIYRPPEPAQEADARRRAAGVARRARRLAVPALAALLIAGALVGLPERRRRRARRRRRRRRCNGHAALCDRPLDEVVLPATHNSMSAPLPGWFSSEQERPIGAPARRRHPRPADRHPLRRPARQRPRAHGLRQRREDLELVKTRTASATQASRRRCALRERLGFRGEGKRGMYLCHTFCELGATPLVDGLEDIHDFLVTHPDEVVVVINQDYVTPGGLRQGGRRRRAGAVRVHAARRTATGRRCAQMIEARPAARRAGREPRRRGALVPARPTSGSRRRRRSRSRSAALLTDPAALPASCAPNRGPDERAAVPHQPLGHAPIRSRGPSDATKVNAYGPLLARARECERIRHHLPNLLAVNFYRRGDVFRVVDTLNGV